MRVTAGSAVLAAVMAATATVAVAEDLPSPSPSTEVTRSSSPAPTTPPPTTTPAPSDPNEPSDPNDPPRTLSPSEDREPDHPVPLSGAFLASQIAEADRITRALTSSNSTLAAATREMDALSDRSNALLESLVAARETQRAATDEAS